MTETASRKENKPKIFVLNSTTLGFLTLPSTMIKLRVNYTEHMKLYLMNRLQALIISKSF
jgi:hypothetical protein